MEKIKMKEKFYECISKNIQRHNSFQMDSVKYNKLIEDVKMGKTVNKKESRQYYLLLHYDVIRIGGKEHLIVPKVNDQILFYVTTEELFDILYETHELTGHGGRDRMRKELKKRYKNITLHEIQTFINLCEQCLLKKKSGKKDSVVKALNFQYNSKCQIDLIDYHSNADGEFKFIMVYQDYLTKFVILRALRSQTAEEVAPHILDIFLLFGAPSILQSNYGCEFCKEIIDVLKIMWPQLKIIQGTTPTSVQCINQDIENTLTTWMQDNSCNNWSKGLPFVQFMKNQASHDDIKKSPFEAMFGQAAKLGLATSTLTRDIIDKINTEEELEMLTQEEKRTEEEKEKETQAVNIHEKIFLSESDTLSNDYICTEEALLDTDIKIEINKCDICKRELDTDVEICDICYNNKNKLYESEEYSSNQAKRIKYLSDVSHLDCEIGTTVRIQIPKIDKNSGELCSILAKILKKTEDGYFQLGTSDGILEGLYSRSQFSICTETFTPTEDVRTGEMRQSTVSGQGYNKCVCTKDCSTNKCSCVKKQVSCNSKCHSNLQCCNK